VTEIVVLLVLRTNRPFFRSRVARTLLVTSGSLAAVTIAVPYTPLARPLGLTALGWPIIGALAGLTVIYILANETAKRRVPPDRPAVTPPMPMPQPASQ
jgi:Mg2+-importing ATPase